MLNLIGRYGGGDLERPAGGRGRQVGDVGDRRQGLQMLRRISSRGPREADMVANILRSAARKPAVLPTVMHFLGRYEQARYMLDYTGAAA
jgi:hypothetical protein